MGQDLVNIVNHVTLDTPSMTPSVPFIPTEAVHLNEQEAGQFPPVLLRAPCGANLRQTRVTPSALTYIDAPFCGPSREPG